MFKSLYIIIVNTFLLDFISREHDAPIVSYFNHIGVGMVRSIHVNGSSESEGFPP